ncbi:MAG: hydrolase [Oscillospiraceae bacterium]|nr:hydrolase [Oscillospiraceae bacterium]
MEKKKIPQIESRLRHNILEIPKSAYKASGILIYGKRIRSLVFTTDIAIIRNCDADAVLAVYPFTPQQIIADSIIKAADMPVFCGVGGGITNGMRTVNLAKDAEHSGAMGVVMNAPITNDNIRMVAAEIDAPIVVTVTSENTNIQGRLDAGVSILNVACGKDTAKVVRKIRQQYPDVPIMASGGNTDELIAETIAAGANAITYTPPSTYELFKKIMVKYRD